MCFLVTIPRVSSSPPSTIDLESMLTSPKPKSLLSRRPKQLLGLVRPLDLLDLAVLPVLRGLLGLLGLPEQQELPVAVEHAARSDRFPHQTSSVHGEFPQILQSSYQDEWEVCCFKGWTQMYSRPAFKPDSVTSASITWMNRSQTETRSDCCTGTALRMLMDRGSQSAITLRVSFCSLRPSSWTLPNPSTD